MAKKPNKQTGLDRPEIEGMDSMFYGSESKEPERTQKEKTSHSEAAQPKDKDQETGKVKTSLYLNQETLEILHDLRYAARKRENRVVTLGELMDTAVSDLAKKMKVTHNSEIAK